MPIWQSCLWLSSLNNKECSWIYVEHFIRWSQNRNQTKALIDTSQDTDTLSNIQIEQMNGN